MNKKEKILQMKHFVEQNYNIMKKKRNNHSNAAKEREEEFIYLEPKSFISNLAFKTYVSRSSCHFFENKQNPYFVEMWNKIDFEIFTFFHSFYIEEIKICINQKREEVHQAIIKERNSIQKYTVLKLEEEKYSTTISDSKTISQEFLEYYQAQHILTLYDDTLSHTQRLLSLLQQEYELSS